MSETQFAIQQIVQLEEALKPALRLAKGAHLATMRASERIGEQHHTGAAHSCLALMEVSVRALNQANDAARYSRHSLEYPSTKEAP